MPRISGNSYDDMSYRVSGSGGDGSGSLSPFTFLCVVLIIAFFGLIILYSASFQKAIDNSLPHYYYFIRQLVSAGCALAAGLLLSIVPMDYIRRAYVLFVPVSIIISSVSLFPGFSDSGYFAVGGYRIIHTGSFALFASVFLASGYIPDSDALGGGRIRDFVLSTLGVMVMMVLSLFSAGLSWYVIIGFTVIAMLRAKRISYMAIAVSFAAMAAAAVVFLSIFPELLAPAMASVMPVSDGTLYSQSLLRAAEAIKMGGIAGIGLGMGNTVAYPIDDQEGLFIFASLVRELGLSGCLFIIIFFLLVLLIGLRTASRGARKGDEQSAALAIGLTLMIVLKAFMNMLYVTGILPLPGILLPFFSYSLSEEAMNIIASCILYRLIYILGRRDNAKA